MSPRWSSSPTVLADRRSFWSFHRSSVQRAGIVFKVRTGVFSPVGDTELRGWSDRSRTVDTHLSHYCLCAGLPLGIFKTRLLSLQTATAAFSVFINSYYYQYYSLLCLFSINMCLFHNHWSLKSFLFLHSLYLGFLFELHFPKITAFFLQRFALEIGTRQKMWKNFM